MENEKVIDKIPDYFEPPEWYIPSEECAEKFPKQESQITINFLVAAMVAEEVEKQLERLMIPFSHSLETIGETVEKSLLEIKERSADVIAAQFDALKVGEVARAVEEAVKQAVTEGKAAADMEFMKEIQKKYNVAYKYSEINELIDSFEDIKKEINSKRQTSRTVRQFLADADMDLKEAEAGILSDIMAETNHATGKPVFSNDKARQAELMVRKKEDGNYTVIAQQYKTVRDQAEVLEDEISFLDAELKAAEMHFQTECKTLEAMTAEMNMYAAAIGAGGKMPAYVVNNTTNNPAPSQFHQETVNKNKGAW